MKTLIALSLLVLGQVAQAFYEPSLGRFINRDPYGDWGSAGLADSRMLPIKVNPWESYEGANLYIFVHNDPVDAIDPDGRKCLLMSNGMVYDTEKQQVVYWSSDEKATRRFIANCNFRDKLPILGICLIVLGGEPKEETCFLGPNGPVMGFCVYNCPSGPRVVPADWNGCPWRKKFKIE